MAGVATALTEALHAGVRLAFTPDPTRPRLRCPDGTEPLVRLLLEPERRPEFHRLLRHAGEYREALRGVFGLMASGSGSAEQCRRFLDEEARLADELGPALAAAVRRAVGREWWKETGVCPWCGTAGTYHEVRSTAP